MEKRRKPLLIRWKRRVNILIGFYAFFPKRINNFLFIFFRNTMGKRGMVIRYALLRNLAKKCGDNVTIYPGAYLFELSELSLGDNISIHPMCYINAAGGLFIGDDVSIAHATSILTKNHDWEDVSVPIKYNAEKSMPVTIQNDVWIGCGVRILPGVVIHMRSVVAAGAVVTRNVESNTLVGGVPAKMIKRLS